VGAVALLTILAAHAVATFARFNAWAARLVDHRVRVLVDHGRLRRDQLRVCGLTEADLVSQLRRRGAERLEDLRYVLYEAKGDLTIVPEEGQGGEAPLVAQGLRAAAGFGAGPGRPARGDG
jgi:uncharacterized membrane protein YcaP (DUF421 family)